MLGLLISALWMAGAVVANDAQAQRRPKGPPPPDADVLSAVNPGAVVFWTQQAALARPQITQELRTMRDELVALRALSEEVRGPNRDAILARLRTLEGRVVALTERLEAALPPVAFATINPADWGIMVPVPTPPQVVVIHEPAPMEVVEPQLPFMAPSDYQALLQQLRTAGWDSTRTTSLQSAMADHVFDVAQVQEILATYQWDSDRFKAAELLMPRVVDTERAFRLLDSFAWDSDKEKMKKLISRHQRK
jgi:hypothetical protein